MQFMPEDVAKWYVGSELGVEKGSEERWPTMPEDEQRGLQVQIVVGKTSVTQWVSKNKDAILEEST